MRVPAHAVIVLVTLSVYGAMASASSIKRDETVVFFPTAAHLTADGGGWVVPIHAWVFELEEDSLKRRGALAGLSRLLGLEKSAARSAVFKQRARWFLVDNESGKHLSTTLTSNDDLLGPSGRDGHLRGEITLQRATPSEEASSFWLRYAAALPRGDRREFRGDAMMIPPRGLSVISDIDDTIKISQVTDKKALLQNTFLRPFEPAPGMAAAYQRLAAGNAVFHYVSSSPWQLYPALRDFMDAKAFPLGSFHLRKFRVKDQSLFNLFKSSQETKPSVIDALLATYPKRDFILIGDSGEQDPEIYGDIARRYPDRVRHIYIRKVTPETPADARYQAAFASLPASLWTVFDDPAVIAP